MSHQRIASDRPAPALWVRARDGRDDLVLMAAGSLRRAMGDIAAAFERGGPAPRVRLVFGASGLLLEQGR